MMLDLSVALITYNEEHNIERTLLAAKSIADEIIIVDSHSTDATAKIAERLGATVYIEDWKGFGRQKNSAIAKCKGRWILMIDADEVVSEQLAKKIREIVDSDIDKFVYEVNRCTVCFGRELKHGGWSNDYIVRLFKNGAGVYSEDLVHEHFLTKYSATKIENKLFHFSYKNIEDYLTKFNQYTSLGALENYKKGKKGGIFHICFSPIFKFIKMYIFRLGFLDGVPGFFIACFSSMYTMVKYFKLRELRNNKNQIN